ncbi:MAG: hypothetical protein COX62_06800 [Deltaproteobacteria bacterium CG_4_10_14_0_2_um_filter_43_8]|nr:MAG: hypothetical protein COV43_06600 [Deltaproteobacteria bacterium CG11_big_fil_rev_8_21_14_0_20_42_23]PJA19414.1 MAG: hypothetical protein COX62_06800 [Deltaproteobacteria bacterium CG_4_10_14_0_2_um_filter_43_8]PJC63994.1 MAG: hypothetical protein CO021_06575 [Deltaproteobacteria bacterium CG_4_9_14_0_2_um_filter_42_21]
MKTEHKNISRIVALSLLVLLAAVSRILPHPQNFTPLIAIAFFGGASFRSKHLAVIIPLAAMLVSDAVIGFHALMPVVYAFFIITTLAARKFQTEKSFKNITQFSVLSSVCFFIATNFAVWVSSGMYEMSVSGLGTCFAAAIPFFQNTLAGTLLYSYTLFYGFSFLEKRVPQMQAA